MSAVYILRGACKRCKCCVDCGVVYVSGVGALVCARLSFFDEEPYEEPFAMLSGKYINPLRPNPQTPVP